MRILCLNPYLPPPPGGIEKEMLSLSSELARLGHEVTCLTTTARFPSGRNEVAERLPTGIRAVRVDGFVRTTLRGFAPARAPLFAPGMAAIAIAEKPDLALVFNLGWGPLLRPILEAVHRICPVLYRSYYHPPGGILRQIKHRYLVATLARADRVIAATTVERGQLLAHGGLEPDRIAVVPPGVHLHEVDPSTLAAVRQRYDLGRRLVVAHVARLSKFKGTLDLIDSLPAVCERLGREIVLLLIGVDQAAREIERSVAQVGSERIRLVGEVRDDGELRTLLRASDLFVLPSAYEAFGIAYIEAMAEGVPCIGCDVGGVREAIGEAGVIVPRFGDRPALEEAMVALLSDERRRRELGEVGRLRVSQKLTWRHTAARFLELGEDVHRARSAS